MAKLIVDMNKKTIDMISNNGCLIKNVNKIHQSCDNDQKPPAFISITLGIINNINGKIEEVEVTF